MALCGKLALDKAVDLLQDKLQDEWRMCPLEIILVLLVSVVTILTKLPDANRTRMTNVYCVYTVLRYFWWWTADLSKIKSTVSNKFETIVHLVGFYCKNNFWMLNLLVHHATSMLWKVNISYTQGYDSKELEYGSLCCIPYFQILDISNCQVDHFYHDNLLKLPALQSLSISDNQLIKLDVEVLETLVHLQRIDLKRQV
jgi:hypothetical protein